VQTPRELIWVGTAKDDLKNEIVYEVSSGNIFQDLGLPHPEERLLRAELAHRIATIIEDRHLTQREAATLMGINQPKVSALLRGHLEGFSFERLARCLVALGHGGGGELARFSGLSLSESQVEYHGVIDRFPI
jgi:predicted XRE-type DNA-binding protein